MPSDPLPTEHVGDDEWQREGDASGPSLTDSVAGLDLVFTRDSPALVIVTEAGTERWVANVARLPVSGTRVISHNFDYRAQFGRNRFDPHGRSAREAVCDLAAKLWA